jgi:hypothetical protein
MSRKGDGRHKAAAFGQPQPQLPVTQHQAAGPAAAVQRPARAAPG